MEEKRSTREITQFLKSLLDVGESYVQELTNELKENNIETLKVSDIYDNEGHQYVNLVQQGGGMLGVALLGYTYILERMGIRFLKLAGTSAGAINATLMATLKPDNSRTLKSPIILYYLAEKNLFDLVDGHPIAKWLVRQFIKKETYFKNLPIYIFYTLIFLPFLFAICVIVTKCLEQNKDNNFYIASNYFLGICLLITGFLGLLLIICIFLKGRFIKSQFGINPGNNFHRWISDLMENGDIHDPADPTSPFQIKLSSGKTIDIYNPKNGVSSLHDLELKLDKIPKLNYNYGKSTTYLKDGNQLAGLQRYESDEPTLALITTELVTENKIIFPKMWKLFYHDRDHVSPADFVRASMSIPIFYEAFRIKNIPKREERKTEWLKYLRYDGNTIDEAVFIDGGSLSNFPINVFNPTKVSTPRLPTFGVRLIDQAPSYTRSVNTLGGIIKSIISTVRYYYDKDFLITHPQYEQCLADIDVRNFNWLDFNLPIDQQVALFEKGAQAAKAFLLKFNWEQYKKEQEALDKGVLSADVRLADQVQDVQSLIYREEIKRGIEKQEK